MISTLLSSRYALIAIALMAGLAGLWGFGKYQHSKGYALAQRDRAMADLESFKSEAERLNGLSVTLEAQLTAIRTEQPKIIERYNRVIIEKPLPAGCVIDTDRMRELNTAIQTSNSRQLSSPVPTNPKFSK